MSLLCLSPLILKAQQITFSGKVVDATTNEILPGVNVYLSGTSFGDATDAEGEFFFETNSRGRFNLIVSFIGYKTHSVPLTLSEPESIYEVIELQPDLMELSEIEVTSISDREWKRVYRDFKSFFLGRDEYASLTEIINPTVIDFKWDETEEFYYVTTTEPLIIRNNALGYESVLEFEEVYFNPKTKGGGVHYLPTFF